jgi:hypothetical protein
MFDAKSVRRALLLTTVLAVSAAPAASARVADAPVHQSRVAVSAAPVTDAQSSGGDYGVTTTAGSMPPRVDGIGQPPTDRGGRVAAPLVQAPSHGGFDWTLAAIGAAALLSLVGLGAAGWTARSRRLAVR